MTIKKTKQSNAKKNNSAPKKLSPINDISDPSDVSDVEETNTPQNFTSSFASFSSLLLNADLLTQIKKLGFEHPSEVQIESIPTAIMGKDLIIQAKSGMGKTAVFVLSSLNRISRSTIGIEVLVIALTRELVHQIASEYNRFITGMDFCAVCEFIGGININDQIKEYQDNLKNKKNIIAVGTPGRLYELFDRKIIDTKKIKIFVVDECDKVFESGKMKNDVSFLYNSVPNNRQVILLSATFSKEALEASRKFAPGSNEIFLDKDLGENGIVLKTLKQFYHEIDENEKFNCLSKLLDDITFSQCIIFISSAQRAKYLAEKINDGIIECLYTHGKIKIDERLKIYEEFKKFNCRVLVTTDLFGRGVDFDNVNFVINYDMPDNWEGKNKEYNVRGSDCYLHRVGRAGRFGTRGLAISFISCDEDKKVLEEIQNRFEIKMEKMPDKMDTESYLNI